MRIKALGGKKLAALALLAALLCPALAPGARAQAQRFSTVFIDTFDTVISLIGYAESEEAFAAQADAAHETYLRLHKLFDNYESYEDEGVVNVFSLNARAAQAPVEVDPQLFGLLSFCKAHYEEARGQTNAAMGSVLSLWHDYREAGLNVPERAQLPPREALEAAAGHTDMDALVLDAEARTVYFADPQLKLDVGAVAKGYATEIVAQALLAGGMPSFVISAGGNVRTGEPPLDGRAAWGVGIQDPDGAVLGTQDIVDALYVSGMSVVTSGDYQRFYTVDGKRYHHLIDPDTLMPGDFYRSVSIITQDSGYADFLSTAAFLMPYEESRAFVDSLPGVEAIWLFPDGGKQYTDGAKKYSRAFGAENR